MNVLLAIMSAAKSIGLALGIFTTGNATVLIANPVMLLNENTISLSCTITNGYSRDLKDLAQTGTPIVAYLIVDVRQQPGDVSVRQISAENGLMYLARSRKFLVVRRPLADSLWFSTLDSACTASMTFERIPLLPRSLCSAMYSYSFSIAAVLGKTTVEALDNSSIDLMYYWDYKRPAATTDEFPGATLQQSSKR